jgi:hypothetical protein
LVSLPVQMPLFLCGNLHKSDLDTKCVGGDGRYAIVPVDSPPMGGWERAPFTGAIVDNQSAVDDERRKTGAAERDAELIDELLKSWAPAERNHVVHYANGPGVQLTGTLQCAVGNVDLKRCTPVVGQDDRSGIGNDKSPVDVLFRARNEERIERRLGTATLRGRKNRGSKKARGQEDVEELHGGGCHDLG